MNVDNKEQDELEKLLAEVQRTIRDNALFVRHLKEEAVESALDEEECNDDPEDVVPGEFEEL